MALLWILVATVLAASNLLAGDWPQWGGPGRDFHVQGVHLAESWPAGGPPQLWERELGEGYSGISVVDGVLFTMYRQGDDEVAVALKAEDGATLWEYRYAAPLGQPYEIVEGPGPHSTPLVAGGRVFTVGASGKLHSLDAKSGKLLWKHDLIEDYGGNVRVRGYSCSPLAFQNMVILMVGGPGRAVMAFDQSDGSVVWESVDARNSHSSPVLIDLDGETQLVAFLFDEIVGLDPASGKKLWSHPHTTDYGLNISTPIWNPEDRILFVSSAYGGGSRAIRLKKSRQGTTVEELWFSRRMRIHFGDAIRIDDCVYGTSGDFGTSLMTAIQVKTGELAWRSREVGKGSMLLVDGKLLILTEEGDLVLAKVTAERLEVLARVKTLDFKAWTVPTLVGNRLYLRDRKVVKALQLE